MPNSSSRIFGYDLIKTIAIFLIVFYHLGGLDFGQFTSGEIYFPNLAKIVSAFCASGVPLFFMVNGALLIPRQLTWKELGQKVAKLLFLYIFWKFVLQYLLCQQLFGIEEKMVHFWFLLTLAAIYLASWVLDRYRIVKTISLIVIAVCPFFSNLVCDLIVFSRGSELSFLRHTGLFTLYSLIYFYGGFFLSRRKISFLQSLFSIICGLVLINFEVFAYINNTGIICDSVNFAFPTIGAFLLSSGIFSLLKDIETSCIWSMRSISFIGRNTMGIFLFHVLIIFWLRYFFPTYMAQYTFLGAFFFSLGVMIISALMTQLFRKARLSFLVKI